MAIAADEDTLPRARRSLAALVARWSPLDPTGRKVLVLREATDLTLAEIADVLELSEADTRRALREARATLV